MTTDPNDRPTRIVTREERDGVTIATLGNGLKIIIQEDNRTPLAICQVWVRVGSNREPDHLRGWAHGIEHMVFKGTECRAEGDFAREVAEMGGTTNASTGYETTSYHILAPKEQLAGACDILADALFAAVFAPDSLDAERKVLVHENHMYDDIPYGFGVTWRWGMAAAFDDSPYQYPIGGEDEVLLTADREEIVAFYHTMYRPDNMTVIVVGDVTADEALEVIRTHFGRIPASETSFLPEPPRETPQTSLRYLVKQGDLEKAYAKLIFHAVPESDPAHSVQSLVKRILSDGRSCRLFRTVQEEKQLVSDISALSETGLREGVLMVDMETNPEQLLPAIEATLEVLEGLKSVEPETDELDRVKMRVERSFVFNAETVQGQSGTLGHYDAMGDLDGAFRFPARAAAVTGEEVTRFCAQVFRRGNLTLLVYLPEKVAPEDVGLPMDSGEMDTILATALSDASPEPAPGRTDSSATGKTAPVPKTGNGLAVTASKDQTPAQSSFTATHLDNGMAVFHRADHTVPTVTLSFYTRGGSSLEPSMQAGLANLAQHVQIKGSHEADAETVHRRIESLGGSLSAQVDRDFSGLSISVLAHQLEPVLAQVGDLICRPSFPELELKRERELAQNQLQAIGDDAFQSAARALRDLIYGDHPYGRPIIGLESSLPELTRDQLVGFWNRVWVAENLTCVVSGDVTAGALMPLLETSLADLSTATAPEWPKLAPITSPVGAQRQQLTRDMNQSVVFAAWPGPPDPNRDRAALMLFKELMNGQSGRLFEALRNRQSLCYNTGLLSTAGFGQGMLAGYVLTDPANASLALASLQEELVRMTESAVPGEEFERARAKLIGNLLISTQANSARVARCAFDTLYQRGPGGLTTLLAQIRDLKPRDIQQAAAQFIDAENRFEVVLGPETTK
ncbi:MAG: pitrilysin family protein [bacterium]